MMCDSELVTLTPSKVMGERSVRNDEAKYLFYERTAAHGLTATHETRAAVTTGNTVRSEVEKFDRQASSISTQGTNSARR